MTAPISIPDRTLITRRSIFIGAAASLLCAPAIVRAANLMPVRRIPFPYGPQYAGFVERLFFQSLDGDVRSGKMTTHLNGEIVSESDARRIVKNAQAYGWLPPYISYTARIEEGGQVKNVKTAQFGSEAEASRRSVSQIAVLHIPHSSQRVPKEQRQTILLDDAALNSELLRITDTYTDELFPATSVEAGRVVFPLSRLVCDVERFPLDKDEPMVFRGMGVFYTRTSMGDVLRVQPNATDRQILMERWYWPHHLSLERIVNDVVERCGICLIVDCHSFPSVALPYELDQTSHRADICIGTDVFHTPSVVRDAIVVAAQKEGYSVIVDAPFAGALVPLASYQKDRHVLSVMIEVNRHLYMDENTGLKTPDFEQVRAAVGRLIVAAAGEAAALQLASTP
jgi:N-formylglutamate deformylase